MKIDSRVFLVTGGASGLGAATAHMLVAAGGQVVIADPNHEAGGRAAVAAATRAFGALHGLVQV